MPALRSFLQIPRLMPLMQLASSRLLFQQRLDMFNFLLREVQSSLSLIYLLDVAARLCLLDGMSCFLYDIESAGVQFTG